MGATARYERKEVSFVVEGSLAVWLSEPADREYSRVGKIWESKGLE